ncbi:MAG: proprotein convertase P-domain-containing protein, partial [Saprospiraceae bacterium]|nr:proprotein convertase P-domain-containing protein [Saprospiraceae bacterium]
MRISRLVRLPDFPAKLLLLAALTLAGLSGVQGQNGCSCTNCPQFLYDNFQGNFYIQVQNAGNPTLGQNGQGVCGVVLHFNHEYLGDLSVQLTSPAGQTVTLIQPVGMFGETDGASWNITFVPCSVPADPDPGFAEVWTNDQPWGILGNYTGSYYPNAGCLEDFNQGPVNGQWTLSVTDGLNEDVGNFFNYSILFCDPSGVECTTCEANAGNLLQSDISACVGDSTLRLNLPPTYAPPQSPPPPAVYDYSYVVASGGIIIKYDTVPDLTGLPSGKYSVCGLSYLAADSTEIPPPDGMFTVTQLAAQLNSATPPFCGNITPNCVAVAILPPAPAVYDTATICAPACYDFYGKKYCATGQYAIQVHQNGCSFQAYLNLNVLPLASDTLEEIVCAGQCSGTPGFDTICTPGLHSRALPGVNGCDSLVVLHLTVLAPDAAIESPGILTCDTPQQTLSSAHPASGQNFSWTAFNGGNLAGPVDLPQATADKPGDYRLVLCAVENGASCCDTAHVTLSAQQDLPAQPPAIYGLAEICPNSLGNWRIDTVPGASGYVWTFPAGVNVLSGFNTDSIQLRWGAGNAGALCVRAENACGLGPAACLDIGLKPAAGAPDSLSAPAVICAGDTTLLVAWHATAAQSFIWQFPPNAQAIGAVASDSVWLVWTPGDPGLVCVRAAGDCDTSAALCKELWVGELPGTPVLAGPDSVCGGSISVYSALPATGAEKYVWEITGGQIVGNADSSAITVYWPAQGGMGQVCLSAQNACGIGPAECRAVAIRAVEPAFAGADTVVCGNAVVLQAIASP